MIKYILRCTDDHKFEAWFRSEAEFDRQVAADPAICPVCELAALRSGAGARRGRSMRHSPTRSRERQFASPLKH